MKRRQMLTTAATMAAGGIFARDLVAQGGNDTDRNLADGHKPLTLADRRFRWVFIRALKAQRRRGKVDKKTYRRLTVAIWSGMPIAGVSKNLGKRPFVQHLRHEVAKKQVHASGIFDIFDGFEWSFDGMLTWLMENWQLVLRIALSLLIFLDAAEADES